MPSTDVDVEAEILALVADKTGYPADMLALDLDLEADLGIDTVKQAEVFATIRERYGIERDDQLKLRDYPTLAHVIGFVRDRTPTTTTAPATAAPAPETVAVAEPAPSTDVDVDVSPRSSPWSPTRPATPPTCSPSTSTSKPTSASTPSNKPKCSPPSASATASNATTNSNSATTPPSPTSSASSATAPRPRRPRPRQPRPQPETVAVAEPAPPTDVDVESEILALVADKTGYPADMLALDLDLEADLGIDTVKQAEVFATIRERYGIERDDQLKLRDYPTLAHVIGFVRDRTPTTTTAPDPTARRAGSRRRRGDRSTSPT